MINIKKISIIALTLLLVGAVGSFITFHTINESITINEEKTIKNPDITTVKVDANNERVEILPSDESTAKVVLSGRSTGDIEDQLTVNTKGDTLVVEFEDKKLFNFFNFIGTNLTLTVYLPEKMYKSFDVEIDNGSVYAEQLNINHVKAETNNGHIEMENIEASAVHVESDNGEISLENVTGKINGETNNGKIYLETNNLDRPITLESDNGAIKVKAEKEPANATFNVHVDNGHINIFDQYSGNVVFGDGENLISLTTNNGKIIVTK